MATEKTFMSDGIFPDAQRAITILETQLKYIFESDGDDQSLNVTVDTFSDQIPSRAKFVPGVRTMSGSIKMQPAKAMPEIGTTFVDTDGRGWFVVSVGRAVDANGLKTASLGAQETICPLVTSPYSAAGLTGSGGWKSGVAITPVTATVNSVAGAVTWELSGGPAGVVINASTGAITGTPTEDGAFAMHIKATGKSTLGSKDPDTGVLNDVTGERIFSITVAAAGE